MGNYNILPKLFNRIIIISLRYILLNILHGYIKGHILPKWVFTNIRAVFFKGIVYRTGAHIVLNSLKNNLSPRIPTT